jgi:hypothetical protein
MLFSGPLVGSGLGGLVSVLGYFFVGPPPMVEKYAGLAKLGGLRLWRWLSWIPVWCGACFEKNLPQVNWSMGEGSRRHKNNNNFIYLDVNVSKLEHTPFYS